MQQDKLRDFLKFFRFHLPWFVLSAGFLAVIVVAGMFFSSRMSTQQQTTADVSQEGTSTPEISIEDITTVSDSDVAIEQATMLPAATPVITPSAQPTAIPATPQPTPNVSNDTISEVTPTRSASSYVVKQGDTLWDISLKVYGDGGDYSRISHANNLTNPSLISVGQILNIPAKQSSGQIASGASVDTGANRYVIVKGDSLWKIAERELGDAYRWTEIYELNEAVIGVNPDLIYPEVSVQLPGSTSGSVQSNSSSSPSTTVPSSTSSATSSSSVNSAAFNWTSSLLQ